MAQGRSGRSADTSSDYLSVGLGHKGRTMLLRINPGLGTPSGQAERDTRARARLEGDASADACAALADCEYFSEEVNGAGDSKTCAQAGGVFVFVRT